MARESISTATPETFFAQTGGLGDTGGYGGDTTHPTDVVGKPDAPPKGSVIDPSRPPVEKRTYHADNPTQARRQAEHEFGTALHPKGSDEDRVAFEATQHQDRIGGAGAAIGNLPGGYAKTSGLGGVDEAAVGQNEERQTERESSASPHAGAPSGAFQHMKKAQQAAGFSEPPSQNMADPPEVEGH